jgi:hypothetical protein
MKAKDFLTAHFTCWIEKFLNHNKSNGGGTTRAQRGMPELAFTEHLLGCDTMKSGTNLTMFMKEFFCLCLHFHPCRFRHEISLHESPVNV